MNHRWFRVAVLFILIGVLVGRLVVVAAQAERIKNPLALFSGLDKITGVTTDFEVKVGEEAKFGSFFVKPFVCFTRPVTEEPKTTGFVQVDVLGSDGKRTRAFSGWMFASTRCNLSEPKACFNTRRRPSLIKPWRAYSAPTQ